MSSHRTIHYGLRPAKNIERKMICEAIQRLDRFRELQDYRYTGFGSRYFSDFIIFHKLLGIKQMMSIEKDTANKEWFEFNKPYKCITPLFDHSNNILPKIDWSPPTILWLDYDGKLEKSCFEDIDSFCSNAIPGSVLLITVNAEPSREPLQKRKRQFINDTGENRWPSEFNHKDLVRTKFPKLLRKIIDNEIQEYISIRNGVLADEKKIRYKQLFNFLYEDGAQMVTMGGIIYEHEQASELEKCSFNDFNYIKFGEDNYKIEVPNLTFREIHFLNQLLPVTDELPLTFIPNKEFKQYAQIYRYFPTFTEAEV